MGRGQKGAQMIGFLRLAVFGFIAMSVAYVLLSIYSRSVRREELEKKWDSGAVGGDDNPDRDAYIEGGMKEYEKSLRRKLIWLVYVLPTAAVLVLLFLNQR
jgi:Ca2+/Na+ antiporter